MRRVFCGICVVLMLCAMVTQGAVRVASLHPLLSDMARQVGGDAIEVVDLFPANGELHAFEPTAADAAAAAGAALVLACGKGVEPYLEDLRDSLPARTTIVELGNAIPDVYLPGTQIADPHWWNSPNAMKRASRSLKAAFEKILPEQEAAFTAGQRQYAKLMDTLAREARLVIARIPHEQRVLVTSHAAMCHFCKDFGFTPVPVQGIAQESEGDTASLARILSSLRKQSVRCLFYGVNESPRTLQTIAAQVGATTRPLALDGIYPANQNYADLFRFNIRHIVEGLHP